eukprot:jgi/Chlat1/5358/Chrsp35S05282
MGWTEEVHARRGLAPTPAGAPPLTGSEKKQGSHTRANANVITLLAAAGAAVAFVIWRKARQKPSDMRRAAAAREKGSGFRFPAVKAATNTAAGAPQRTDTGSSRAAPVSSSLPRNKTSNNKKNKARKAEKRAAKAAKLEEEARPTAVHSAESTVSGSAGADGACAGCEKPIKGKSVTAMKRKWHDGCFNCTICHKSFTKADGRLDKFKDLIAKTVGGRTWRSAVILVGSRAQDPLNKDNLKETIIALGRHYHKSCFKCGQCGRVLTGDFHTGIGGRPLCNMCGRGR